MYICNLSPPPPIDSSEVPASLTPPSVDVVHGHIKNITQYIQELFKAAQSHQQTNFGPCSAKIAGAVDTLIKLFPPVSYSLRVRLKTGAFFDLNEKGP